MVVLVVVGRLFGVNIVDSSGDQVVPPATPPPGVVAPTAPTAGGGAQPLQRGVFDGWEQHYRIAAIAFQTTWCGDVDRATRLPCAEQTALPPHAVPRCRRGAAWRPPAACLFHSLTPAPGGYMTATISRYATTTLSL